MSHLSKEFAIHFSVEFLLFGLCFSLFLATHSYVDFVVFHQCGCFGCIASMEQLAMKEFQLFQFRYLATAMLTTECDVAFEDSVQFGGLLEANGDYSTHFQYRMVRSQRATILDAFNVQQLERGFEKEG